MALVKGRKQIYTDGASYDEMGYGAWAAIIINPDGKRHQISGSIDTSKPNVAELKAIIEALRTCDETDSIDVHTDHESIIIILNKQGKTKLDLDMWDDLNCEIDRIKGGVTFYHVSSRHAGLSLSAEVHRLVTSIIKDPYSHNRLALYEQWALVAPDKPISEIKEIIDAEVRTW